MKESLAGQLIRTIALVLPQGFLQLLLDVEREGFNAIRVVDFGVDELLEGNLLPQQMVLVPHNESVDSFDCSGQMGPCHLEVAFGFLVVTGRLGNRMGV